MSDRGESSEASGAARRPITYCLVPLVLAPKLHDLLRHHFREDPSVEVVVERRRAERRQIADRRSAEESAASRDERRRIRGAGGRRVGERRAPQLPVEAPPLPRRARRFAEQITFVERLEPSTQEAEDFDTGRLVTRIQAGDREAFAVLYTRYFDRVYGYLHVVLRNAHEAEDQTQRVFTQVFEKIGEYERRRQPFRAWLFTIVRNFALRQAKLQSRVDLVEPEKLNRRHEEEADSAGAGEALAWISDRDLTILVERLPLPQRQALLLRYMLDLSGAEIASVMGRSESDVRMLQSRALRYLRPRLMAIRGRELKRRDRRARSCPAPAVVARSRRWALLG
jgi:RNA polymerase sigma-70 factor (ECF subfamily)